MKKLFILFLLSALLIYSSAIGALALETETGDGAEKLYEMPEYYGREALESLPNADVLLYAYDKIAAGVEKREDSISVWDGKNPITKAELSTAFDAYRRDRTDHFWLSNSYGITSMMESITTFSPSYIFTEEELLPRRAAFDAAVSSIIESIPEGATELERELYLHDLIADRVSYVDSAPNAHNAYGALVEGEAVCEGYAEALQVVLMRAGIQSFIALGDSLVPTTTGVVAHAWNYVRIGGNYYHVDLTWNDAETFNYHAYFNISAARISEDHSVNAADYALPVCSSERDNYFAVYGGMISDYSASTVADRIRASGEMRASFLLPSRSEAATFKTWVKENIKSISWRMGITTSYSYVLSSLGCEVHVLYEGVCSHKAAVYVSATPATCVAGGEKAHYFCMDCKRSYLDSELTSPVNDGALYTPPLGHTFESDCDAICDRCELEREAPHTLINIESGKRRHTLSCACGKETTTELHSDRKVDGICDVCESPMPVEEPSDKGDGGAALPSADVKSTVITALLISVGALLIIAVFYKLFNRR